MVVDESGSSTSQPIVEEPEDEVQPAASHEASGSTDQAAEAISASLPDGKYTSSDFRNLFSHLSVNDYVSTLKCSNGRFCNSFDRQKMLARNVVSFCRWWVTRR